ncbi:helix-turn-helix domain-containing protein [Sphingomonas sp. PAMC 26621]|uniref:helix-turn-helix domain-containing protein n=1 Tax=Sphingomonas sp. PAMC 26621 TaxID=1112213 RepID=UPI003FD07EFD
MVLGLGRRQVFRLLDRMRAVGAEGLVSRKRGRPSDFRYRDALQDQVIVLLRGSFCWLSGRRLGAHVSGRRNGIRLALDSHWHMLTHLGGCRVVVGP